VFVVDDDEHARKSVCALVRSFRAAGRGVFLRGGVFLPATPPGTPGLPRDRHPHDGMSGLDLQDRLVEQAFACR